LFTTIKVNDGHVFAQSTVNPNDKGQVLQAGYAMTFACAELGVLSGAATSALFIGGAVAGGVAAATGIGLGVAAATGGLGGSGGPSTPTF